MSDPPATRNACELQIALFCHGLRVPERVSLDGARGVEGARAGLASGLELAIPTGSRLKPQIWTNAPVAERFAQASPFVLSGVPGDYAIVDESTGTSYPVRVPRRPGWYTRLTSRDVPMGTIGRLHGTILSINLESECVFWRTPELRCRFCSTGAPGVVGRPTAAVLEDVIETCWAAKSASGVTYVQLSGGFQGREGLRVAEPFVRAIKQDVGLLVGVQLAPEPEFSYYDRLIDLGVDYVSFCVELLDAYWFSRICPGKARALGQPLFFKAMEYCVARMHRGAVVGQVIAGLEPVENTMEAVDRIVSIGGMPAVCIFRPTEGSEMANWPVPRYADMRAVMAAMYDACRRRRLAVGLAPNVESSTVVTADDAALLAPRNAAFYRYELWRRAVRAAARPAFNSRLRPRPRRISVDEAKHFGASPHL
jgi:hypothetical protein